MKSWRFSLLFGCDGTTGESKRVTLMPKHKNIARKIIAKPLSDLSCLPLVTWLVSRYDDGVVVTIQDR